MNDSHEGDRKLLGFIAGGSLLIIAVVAIGVIGWKPDAETMGLLGVIVGGLLVNGKDTIGAIKERWLGQQVQRMSDQLSVTTPPTTDQATGKQGDPVHTVTEETK